MNLDFVYDTEDGITEENNKQLDDQGALLELNLGKMKVSQLIKTLQKAERKEFEGFMECTLKLKNQSEVEQFLIALNLEEEDWIQDTPYYQYQKKMLGSNNKKEYQFQRIENAQIEAFIPKINEYPILQKISQYCQIDNPFLRVENRSEKEVQLENNIEDNISSDDSFYSDNQEIGEQIQLEEQEKIEEKSLDESIVYQSQIDFRMQTNFNQQEISYPVKSLEEAIILWDYFQNERSSNNRILRVFLPKLQEENFDFKVNVKIFENNLEEAKIQINSFMLRMVQDKLILSYSNFQAMKNSENIKKEIWDKFKVKFTFIRSFKKTRKEFNFILYGLRGEVKFHEAKQFLSRQNMIKMYFLTMSNQIYSHKEFQDQQFRTMLVEMRMKIFLKKLEKSPELKICYEVSRVQKFNKKSMFKHGVIFKFDNEVTIFEKIRRIQTFIKSKAFWILQTRIKLIGDDKFQYLLIQEEGGWFYQIFITKLDNFERYLKYILEKNNLGDSFLIILKDKVKTQSSFMEQTAFQKFQIPYQSKNLQQMISEAFTQLSKYTKIEMETLDQDLDTFLEEKKRLFKGIKNNLNNGKEYLIQQQIIQQQSKNEEKNENIQQIYQFQDMKNVLKKENQRGNRCEDQIMNINEKKNESQKNMAIKEERGLIENRKLENNQPNQYQQLFKGSNKYQENQNKSTSQFNELISQYQKEEQRGNRRDDQIFNFKRQNDEVPHSLQNMAIKEERGSRQNRKEQQSNQLQEKDEKIFQLEEKQSQQAQVIFMQEENKLNKIQVSPIKNANILEPFQKDKKDKDYELILDDLNKESIQNLQIFNFQPKTNYQEKEDKKANESPFKQESFSQRESPKKFENKLEKQQNFLFSRIKESKKTSISKYQLPIQIKKLVQQIEENLMDVKIFQLQDLIQNLPTSFFQGFHQIKDGWKLNQIDSLLEEKNIFIFEWNNKDSLKELEKQFNTTESKHLPNFLLIQE